MLVVNHCPGPGCCVDSSCPDMNECAAEVMECEVRSLLRTHHTDLWGILTFTVYQ